MESFEELFGASSDNDTVLNVDDRVKTVASNENAHHSLAATFTELCALPSPPMSPLRHERPKLPSRDEVKHFLNEIGYTVNSNAQLEGIYFSSSGFSKYSLSERSNVSTPILPVDRVEKTLITSTPNISNSPRKSPSVQEISQPSANSDSLQSPVPSVSSPNFKTTTQQPTPSPQKQKQKKAKEEAKEASTSNQITEQKPGKRFSSLTGNEHLLFLELRHLLELEQQRKNINTNSPRQQNPYISPHQYTIFTRLRDKVSKEQEEYRSFRQDIAFEHRKVYLTLNPAIQVQLDQEYSRKRQRESLLEVTKSKQFLPVYAVDVRAINPTTGDPILKHKATLYEEGKCLMFEKLQATSEIPLNIDYFSPNQESFTFPKGNLRWHKKYVPTIFEDKTIKEILDQGLHKVDIILTSSVLSSLIDSFDTWDIPVSIVTHNSKKVVYIGKPFLKSKLTQREKANNFYNVAFRTLALHHPSRTKPIVFDKNKYSIKPKSETSLEKEKELQSNDLEEDNLTYNLWEYGGLHILIRCKIHGFIPDKTSSLGFRYVGIKSKVDYLHGIEKERMKDSISDSEAERNCVEEVTISETAKWWINTFIRPDAHLMLGRVDVQNSKIIDIEKKTMVDILPPGCLFRPEKATKIIYVLLSKLPTLDEGSYILSHKTGEHNIVILKGEANPSTVDTKCYDISTLYSGIPATDLETIPYIPLKWRGPPIQVPDTFDIKPNWAPKKGWSIASVISKPDRNYCPTFISTGNCTDPNCDLAHKPIEQVSNLSYCVPFAYLGYCKSPQCGLTHITFLELTKRAWATKKRKKKHKKKKERTFEEQLQNSVDKSLHPSPNKKKKK